MGRISPLRSAFAVLLSALAAACVGGGEPVTGPSPGSGAPGAQGDGGPPREGVEAPTAGEGGAATTPPAPAGETLGFELGEAGSDVLREISILLGADRRPAYAIDVIREVHDLKDYSHRVRIPDAVERCRGAVADLGRSDYTEWDETGMVVVVLSTLALRDSAAIVRNDCVRVLAWFFDWVHPVAAGIPPGGETTEEGVLNALKAMEAILDKEKPFAEAADRLVLTDAVSVLGSHPWSDMSTPDPRLARNRLAQPRGVVRALAARAFRDGRDDAVLADSLDRAIIRVADQVLALSLIAALADPAAHVRAAAARALGERAVPGAVEMLAASLARESESSVRIAWIAALGELGARDEEGRKVVVPALAGVLGDPDGSVRRAAVRELARLTGENPGPESTDWQRWWRENAPEYEKP